MESFAFDLPLIAISLGGAIEFGYLGYRRGRVLDWEAGFKQAWLEHTSRPLCSKSREQ